MVDCRPALKGRLSRASLAFLLSLLGGAVLAQSLDAATAAYRAAQLSFEAALASGETPHPDQPSWTAAQAAADLAARSAQTVLDAAGGAAAGAVERAAARDAYLLSARVHSLTGWHSRALAAWKAYLGLGGELDGSTAPPGQEVIDDALLFIDVSFQLAFSRYQVGDFESANGYYLDLIELFPEQGEALRWLGRIAFETNDPEGAERYFGALLALSPNDESAAYFLQLSRERQAVGATASDAFRQGIAQYEAGELGDAFASFQSAFDENPAFVDAAVWAGRTALEMRAPEVAVEYWSAVVRGRPDDAGAAWFLEYSRAQVEHGVEAGAAYYEGLADYQAGDLDAAAAAFERASAAAPGYLDALTWAARSHQEAGRFEEAAAQWRSVVALDPTDERARWFLQRAEQALLYGAEAGTAYFDGAALYLAGDIEGAKAQLATAVEANPELAIAWGYLGRIALQEARYEDAARAYQRAFELTGDEDYEFFAEEARRRSQPTPSLEVPPPTILPPLMEPVPPD